MNKCQIPPPYKISNCASDSFYVNNSTGSFCEGVSADTQRFIDIYNFRLENRTILPPSLSKEKEEKDYRVDYN